MAHSHKPITTQSIMRSIDDNTIEKIIRTVSGKLFIQLGILYFAKNGRKMKTILNTSTVQLLCKMFTNLMVLSFWDPYTSTNESDKLVTHSMSNGRFYFWELVAHLKCNVRTMIRQRWRNTGQRKLNYLRN